jgi:hypothetical protein
MKKKFVMPLLVVMAILSMLAFAEGACTFVTPTSSSTIMGSKLFNVTCATLTKPLNCTVTGSSSASGDTDTFYLYNTTTVYINATRVTTINQQDANDWTFTGSCVNGTGAGIAESITAITGVVVDNTKPGTPTISSPAADSTVKNSDIITYTVQGVNVTACTIYFTSGTNYAMTHSGNTCTYTVSRTAPPDLDYNTYITATDGLNTSTSAATHLKIDAIPEADQVISGDVSMPAEVLTQKQGPNYTVLVVIGIVIFLAIMFSQKNKK